MIARRLLFAAPAAILAAPAIGQAPWPTRPIRIVVPFAPGGSVDIMGRAVAHRLQERIGQPVTVENRSGANGAVGGIAVSQAAPDGHTLLVSASIQTVARLVMRDPGYDPLTDLTPIARLGEGPVLLAINPQRPEKTVAELAASARAKPQEWSFGVGSLGSAGHLATVELIRSIGVDLTTVPYRGTSPALADLLAGNIGAHMDPVLAMLPPVRAGTLRGLAVTAPQRLTSAPDIPTTAEAGYPSVDLHSWWAVWGPRGLPAPLAARIAEELQALIAEPELRARLSGAEIQPLFETGAAFQSYVQRDYARAEELLRIARVQPE